MKRTYYNKNNEQYLRAQFSMFQSAVNKIFESAQSNGITVEVEDIERLLSSSDPDSVLLEIYLKPIEEFKQKFDGASSLKLMISEQEKPYRQAAFSLALVLNELMRYNCLDLDFGLLKWDFENLGKKCAYIVSVDKEVLDECIKDKCTINLSDNQLEIIKLVESFCKSKNDGLEVAKYVDWSFENQKYTINEQHLMNDVLKM